MGPLQLKSRRPSLCQTNMMDTTSPALSHILWMKENMSRQQSRERLSVFHVRQPEFVIGSCQHMIKIKDLIQALMFLSYLTSLSHFPQMLLKTPQCPSVHQVWCQQVAGWTWPAPAEPSLPSATSPGSRSAEMESRLNLKDGFTSELMWQIKKIITVWLQMISETKHHQWFIWILKVNTELDWTHFTSATATSVLSRSHLVCFYEQKHPMDLYSRFLEDSLDSSCSSAWLSVFGKWHKWKQLMWLTYWDFISAFMPQRANVQHSLFLIDASQFSVLEAVQVDRFNSTTESGRKMFNFCVEHCTLIVLHY